MRSSPRSPRLMRKSESKYVVSKLPPRELDGCLRNSGNGGVSKEGNCDSPPVGFTVVLSNTMRMLLLLVTSNVWANVAVTSTGGSGHGVPTRRSTMLSSSLLATSILWYTCGSREHIGLERWSLGGEQ